MNNQFSPFRFLRKSSKSSLCLIYTASSFLSERHFLTNTFPSNVSILSNVGWPSFLWIVRLRFREMSNEWLVVCCEIIIDINIFQALWFSMSDFFLIYTDKFLELFIRKYYNNSIFDFCTLKFASISLSDILKILTKKYLVRVCSSFHIYETRLG